MKKTNAMTKTAKTTKIPKHRQLILGRLMTLCNALVKEFVTRVMVKGGKEEKSADVFVELNNKWTNACKMAGVHNWEMQRLFYDRIKALSETTNGVARELRNEQIIGWVIWIGLFVLGLVGIGKFCEWTLSYFYPWPL